MQGAGSVDKIKLSNSLKASPTSSYVYTNVTVHVEADDAVYVLVGVELILFRGEGILKPRFFCFHFSG